MIITDCGREFELKLLETICNGNLNSNINFTFTIYRTPSQEYIQKKSFFNPAMNHTSINYEMIPQAEVKYISNTLESL
jgi:hypothetical protein